MQYWRLAHTSISAPLQRVVGPGRPAHVAAHAEQPGGAVGDLGDADACSLGSRSIACSAAATAAAAQRLPGVASHRCHTLLGQLRPGLARRKRNAWAADAVEQLDAVLVHPRR